MTVTLFLLHMATKAFLVVLDLVTSLVSVSGRFLELLFTRYVSKKSVSELILLRVFILLFYRFISLKTLGMNLVNI